ncbi:MAG: hypothetical protein M0Z42_20845 [Actinomycetota bacterium]|jgi:hypothetical protein|nr:hypothetical protein [Actinomycetota bacterium]
MGAVLPDTQRLLAGSLWAHGLGRLADQAAAVAELAEVSSASFPSRLREVDELLHAGVSPRTAGPTDEGATWPNVA